MRRYKVMVLGRLKDQETAERLRDRAREFLDDDCEVIICDGGVDIKPVEQEYYGIYHPETKSWILGMGRGILWYPCRKIAEIKAESLNNEGGFGVEVRSFNGIDEVEIETE